MDTTDDAVVPDSGAMEPDSHDEYIQDGDPVVNETSTVEVSYAEDDDNDYEITKTTKRRTVRTNYKIQEVGPFLFFLRKYVEGKGFKGTM